MDSTNFRDASTQLLWLIVRMSCHYTFAGSRQEAGARAWRADAAVDTALEAVPDTQPLSLQPGQTAVLTIETEEPADVAGQESSGEEEPQLAVQLTQKSTGKPAEHNTSNCRLILTFIICLEP